MSILDYLMWLRGHSIILLNWQLGKVSEDWRKTNATPVFKKGQEGGELQAGQSHFKPKEAGGTANPGKYFQAYEREKNHQEYRFIKGMLCLTSLISIFHEITRFMDKWRAVNIIFLDYSKYGLHEYIMRLKNGWMARSRG